MVVPCTPQSIYRKNSEPHGVVVRCSTFASLHRKLYRLWEKTRRCAMTTVDYPPPPTQKNDELKAAVHRQHEELSRDFFRHQRVACIRYSTMSTIAPSPRKVADLRMPNLHVNQNEGSRARSSHAWVRLSQCRLYGALIAI